MSLHALVERWRAYSEGLNGTDSVYMGGIRSGYKECADDLAAALAGGGEVVGEVAGGDPRHDGKHMLYVTFPSPLAEGTKLFTHPAGAVQVTELRKVAKRNLRSLINRSNDSEKELMLKCLEELS